MHDCSNQKSVAQNFPVSVNFWFLPANCFAREQMHLIFAASAKYVSSFTIRLLIVGFHSSSCPLGLFHPKAFFCMRSQEYCLPSENSLWSLSRQLHYWTVRRLLAFWWSTCNDTCRSEQIWFRCRSRALKPEVHFYLGRRLSLMALSSVERSQIWP